MLSEKIYLPINWESNLIKVSIKVFVESDGLQIAGHED